MRVLLCRWHHVAARHRLWRQHEVAVRRAVVPHHRANPLYGLVAYAVELDDLLRPLALVEHAAEFDQSRPALLNAARAGGSASPAARRACVIVASAAARRAPRSAVVLAASAVARRALGASVGHQARRCVRPRLGRRALDASGGLLARRCVRPRLARCAPGALARPLSFRARRPRHAPVRHAAFKGRCGAVQDSGA